MVDPKIAVITILAVGGRLIGLLIGLVVLAVIVVALATLLIVQWRRSRRRGI